MRRYGITAEQVASTVTGLLSGSLREDAPSLTLEG